MLKKNYVDDRVKGDPTALGRFLSNIGYNVSTAVMSAGKTYDYEETQAKKAWEIDENDMNVSNWVPSPLEATSLETLECRDVYANNVLGKKNYRLRKTDKMK